MKPLRHARCELWVHLVWTSAHRARVLGAGFWEHARAKAKAQRAQSHELVAVGGDADHVHLLVRIRPDLKVSDLVQQLKGAWAFWLRRTGGLPDFRWQEGYAAFSVSPNGVTAVRRYVEQQAEHHARGELNDGMEPD